MSRPTTPTRRFWKGPWPWLVAAAVLCVVAILRWEGSGEGEPLVDPRPMGTVDDIAALSERDDTNVLFVMIDTLGAGHLHTYGYHRPTSPFMDFLASQGIRFDRHLGQSSWTKCSMASLWTGLYPQRTGVTRFEDVVPQEARTAAEVFRDAGFRTAGIWRNGWVEGYFGFDQGFEVYTRPNMRGLPADVRRENPTVSNRGTDLDVVDTAAEFLRIHGRERWFLYLHLMDVHEYTYTPESAKFGSAYSDVYDNAILHTNQVLEVLFEELYDGGHLDKTLLVIGSDHGEAFGQRGSEGHARNVYPETTEVPLILGLPFRLAEPVVVRQRTANVDLWPTVFNLLGLPALENVDGRTRVPEILAAARGEPAVDDDEVVAIAHLDRTWGQRVETRSPNVSVSGRDFHYLLFGAPDGGAEEELYRFENGSAGLANVAEQDPELTARMRDRAVEYLAAEPTWESGPGLELDELQLNQLRALGYALPGQ